MKKNIFKPAFLVLLIAWGVLVGNLFTHYRQSLTTKFNPKLIKLYLRSQDIPDLASNKKRVFLSDGQIHTAAGYLYVKGAAPTDYNFQHPPLIKYLFGISTLWLQNPLFVQLVFALILVALTYLLAFRLTHNLIVSSLATILLSTDPLMANLVAQPLLDLGQATFLLLYVYLSLGKRPRPLLIGLALGAAAASKFWAGALFFAASVNLYRLINKKLALKVLALELLVAATVFNSAYLATYLNLHGRFNIVFWQLKTLKYWFHHSTSSVPMASFLMFTTGVFKPWWNRAALNFADVWSVLWPLSLAWCSYESAKRILAKRFDRLALVLALPLLYLVYLGFQAPFGRYFILILPYTYLGLSYFVVKFFK